MAREKTSAAGSDLEPCAMFAAMRAVECLGKGYGFRCFIFWRHSYALRVSKLLNDSSLGGKDAILGTRERHHAAGHMKKSLHVHIAM
jgi:hypothetical protein